MAITKQQHQQLIAEALALDSSGPIAPAPIGRAPPPPPPPIIVALDEKLISDTNNIEKDHNNMTDVNVTSPVCIDIATNIIDFKFSEKQKRNIWGDSKWKNIADMENDDVGGAGEQIISALCSALGVSSSIDGLKTKKIGGGIGDGTINGRTVEIKTARQGSPKDGVGGFQHELGEKPWVSDYMLFLDITPDKMYVTIFRNFPEEFYRSSASNNIKCEPYFPTKSVTQRKGVGAFKLDTTISINEKNTNEYTLVLDEKNSDFKKFVNRIII